MSVPWVRAGAITLSDPKAIDVKDHMPFKVLVELSRSALAPRGGAIEVPRKGRGDACA